MIGSFFKLSSKSAIKNIDWELFLSLLNIVIDNGYNSNNSFLMISFTASLFTVGVTIPTLILIKFRHRLFVKDSIEQNENKNADKSDEINFIIN